MGLFSEFYMAYGDYNDLMAMTEEMVPPQVNMPAWVFCMVSWCNLTWCPGACRSLGWSRR